MGRSQGSGVRNQVRSLPEHSRQKRCNTEDVFVRRKILQVINKKAEKEADETAIPILIGLLEDPDPEIRGGAAEALGTLKKKAKAGIPLLIRLVHDKKSSVRVEAMKALGQMGSEAKKAIPELMDWIYIYPDVETDYAADAIGLIAIDLFDSRQFDALADLTMVRTNFEERDSQERR